MVRDHRERNNTRENDPERSRKPKMCEAAHDIAEPTVIFFQNMFNLFMGTLTHMYNVFF